MTIHEFINKLTEECRKRDPSVEIEVQSVPSVFGSNTLSVSIHNSTGVDVYEMYRQGNTLSFIRVIRG